jgi:hypothetical protein
VGVKNIEPDLENQARDSRDNTGAIGAGQCQDKSLGHGGMFRLAGHSVPFLCLVRVRGQLSFVGGFK